MACTCRGSVAASLASNAITTNSRNPGMPRVRRTLRVRMVSEVTGGAVLVCEARAMRRVSGSERAYSLYSGQFFVVRWRLFVCIIVGLV